MVNLLVTLREEVSMSHVFLAFLAARSFRRQRIFRDRTSILDSAASDAELIRDYRFPRDEIIHLIQFSGVLPARTRRNHGLSAEIQVLTALRFFARGTYQDDVKDVIGISQQSVSRCIDTFLDHMLRKVNQVIRFPKTEDEILTTQQGFLEKVGFPEVIGIIDGTHVMLKTPKLDVECAYICRKGGHSINVQVVCNADLMITDVVAKWPGSNHDAFIWSQSGLRAQLYDNPPSGFILGDSAYPLEPWLLTEYEEPVTISEKKFNAKFATARNCIERAIGVWKNVFRVLLKDAGVLEYEPKKAAKIIVVAAMLHNFRRQLQLPEDEEIVHEPTVQDTPDTADGVSSGEALQLQGQRKRKLITDRFF